MGVHRTIFRGDLFIAAFYGRQMVSHSFIHMFITFFHLD